jgi:hypothetical protein
MNMHIPFAADRTLLPRSLIKRPTRVYRATYTFKLGQLVTFGGTPWTVVNRSRSATGHQLYSLFRHGDVRPLRMALGSALEAAPGDPAEAERLYKFFLAMRRKHRRGLKDQIPAA